MGGEGSRGAERELSNSLMLRIGTLKHVRSPSRRSVQLQNSTACLYSTVLDHIWQVENPCLALFRARSLGMRLSLLWSH